MSDRFRIVTVDQRTGKARPAVDLQYDGRIVRARDTFKFTPPTRRERIVVGDERNQGNRTIGSASDNAQVAAGFIVKGDTPQHAIDRVEALLALVDRINARGDLSLEHAPAGGPESYYPVRGPGTVVHTYQPRALEQTSTHYVEVTWPVAPLAEGPPMDVLEDFSNPPGDDPDDVANLMPNPSPEIDLSFWTAGGNTTLARNAAILVAPGGFEIRMTPTAAGDVAAQVAGDGPGGRFPLAHPDRPVWVALWARIGGGGNERTLYCKMMPFDGTGAALPEQNATVTVQPSGTYTGVNATRIAFPFTMPAGAESFDLEIQGLALLAGQNIAVASLGVYNAFDLPEYGDGDLPDWRWAGAPFGSRSVRLVDDQLREFAVVSDLAKIALRTDPTQGAVTPGSPTPSGIRARTAAQLTTLRHTRYALTDFVAIAKFWHAGAAGANVVAVGKDFGGKRFIARLTTNGNIELLEDGTVRAATSIPALGSNKAWWVVFRCRGRVARAELWDREPQLGGAAETGGAVTLTSWNIGASADAQVLMDAAGYPIVQYQQASAASPFRLLEVRVEPYTFVLPKGPASVILRGVPGSAPAKIDVGLGASAAPPAGGIPFALLAWRRFRRYNRAVMSDREVGYGSWSTTAFGGSALAAGGALTFRDADDGPIGVPPDNRAPAVEIAVSPGVANAGAFHYMPQQFRRGQVYTVEFIYRVVSGAWEHRVYGDAAIEVDEAGAAYVQPLTSATFTKVSFSFVPTVDRANLRAVFRTTSAAAANLRVHGLRVYEGEAPGPDTNGQLDDRGAYPPFGTLLAEGDIPASRVGFALDNTAGVTPNGSQLIYAVPAGGGSARAEWAIDADLLDVPDDSTGEIDVEAWALVQLRSDFTNPRVVSSLAPVRAPGARVYARPDGSAGKAIVNAPIAGGAADIRAIRLGRLALVRDGRPRGRQLLRTEFLFDPGAAGNFRLYYLVLAPMHARASSPSGKVNDAAYPVFMTTPASGLPTKLVTSDLRGYSIPAGPSTVVRDTGLSGSPIEAEPGDLELLAWAQQGQVPDDPVRNNAGAAADPAALGLHARVTPRYRFARGS